MTKTVLTFGLISGAILSLMMAITFAFHEDIGFDRAEVIGYASMVAAFLLIYFGVRSYRDNVAGGVLTFGRGFKVGALIALVASTCYVSTWEVIYFSTDQAYVAQYQAYVLERDRAEGASDEALETRRAELERFAELYDNPVVNVALTFLEPLPIALVFALVSAGLLRRGREERRAGPAQKSAQAT